LTIDIVSKISEALLNPEFVDFPVKGETGDTQQLCGLCKISITQGNGVFARLMVLHTTIGN